MTRSVTRVLVVEDFRPWRDFVRATLQRLPELQIIGEATDGLEAIEKAKDLQPDLVLLDIGLPSLNGIDAARRIRESVPTAKILFLSELHSWEVVNEAMLAGGSGYVVKVDAGRELLAAVNTVLRGSRFCGSRFEGKEVSEI
jgi:DNA-binding NarL/FixJ family response regulator